MSKPASARLEAQRPDGAKLRAGPGGSDYDRVVRVIRFLEDGFLSQPSLAQIAEAAGLSEGGCQKLFRRWCGLSPKEFVQALTVDHARKLLANDVSVLDTAYESGLSSPGRLHDLFTSYEAMPPGLYRSGCAGLTFHYDVAPTPFGPALVMVLGSGVLGSGAPELVGLNDKMRLAGLSFLKFPGEAGSGAEAESDTGRDEFDHAVNGALDSYRARWPKARFLPDESGRAAALGAAVFHTHGRERREEHRVEAAVDAADVILLGTPFETRVWQCLSRVPAGQVVSYSTLARKAGSPAAARAVGRAVGRNPIAFVVPCHRVMGRDGGLTGYHWGITRKRAIIGWEAGAVRFASMPPV